MLHATVFRRQKWHEIITRQCASGMTVRSFCQENRVAARSFFRWSSRLAVPIPDPAPAFVEVKIAGESGLPNSEAPSSPDKLEVHLRGGRRLLIGHGFDRDLLAEVVALLEGLS